MAAKIKAGENPMEFKKHLAFTVTEMYHSTEDAKAAQQHFEQTIQGDEIPTDIPTVTVSENPTQLLSILQQGLPEESNSQLRRLVEQGAVELLPGGEKPSDAYQEIDWSQVETVRVGKRRYFRIEVA